MEKRYFKDKVSPLQLEKITKWISDHGRLPDMYSDSPKEQGWAHWINIHKGCPEVQELIK